MNVANENVLNFEMVAKLEAFLRKSSRILLLDYTTISSILYTVYAKLDKISFNYY